jgi:5-methyltetrahydropteroyltriglutamate--homocysteine methyltransferase
LRENPTMIPTEPLGSIPRPPALVAALRAGAAGERLAALVDDAVRDTVMRMEAAGAPVVSDGEQAKPDFWTYPVHGAAISAPDGFPLPLDPSQARRMPRLVRGPLRYLRYADSYLRAAQTYATVPVKQAVISASALSLMYPSDALPGYPREQFIDDLLREHETDIRRCLEAGAHKVQVDFTEGPLALQLDPSGALLASFIELNNLALGRFSAAERDRIGVYAGAGVTPAANYADLLPGVFELKAGNVYVALAGVRDRERLLATVRECLKPGQRVFVGVTAADPGVRESAAQVRDLVLLAARYIPLGQLGTADDCGFAPFGDEHDMSRDTAFAKIGARVAGTALASAILEGGA